MTGDPVPGSEAADYFSQVGGRDVAESVVTQVQLSYLVVVLTQPLKDVRNLAGEETGVREIDFDQPRHNGAQIFDGDPAKRNPRELEALQVNVRDDRITFSLYHY